MSGLAKPSSVDAVGRELATVSSLVAERVLRVGRADRDHERVVAGGVDRGLRAVVPRGDDDDDAGLPERLARLVEGARSGTVARERSRQRDVDDLMLFFDAVVQHPREPADDVRVNTTPFLSRS